MEEKKKTLVCSFDHQSPRTSAYQIHEWIHNVLHVSEPTVTMIQIDGPRHQVFIKFMDIQYAYDILQMTQGTAKYKHLTAEVSIVQIEMVGLGTKRVHIANLPAEIHEGTLRTHLAPYGEFRTVQEEKWLTTQWQMAYIL